MFSIISKCVLVIFIITFTFEICLAENFNPLIIGRSATKIEHPIIIDPVDEKIFYSKIILKQNSRYELFLCEKEKQFIVVESDFERTTMVYRINILDSRMPNPIFKRMAKGGGYFSGAAWSQEHQALCITEFVRDDNRINQLRRLSLTILDLHKKNVSKNEIDLSNMLSFDTALWTISDYVIILGRKPNSTAKDDSLPDTAIVVNLKDMSITKKDFSFTKAMVIGKLGLNQLVASDDRSLYSYDLNEFKKIRNKPKGVVRIFGKSADNKGCYAHVIKNRLIYEIHAIEFISFYSSKKNHIIFGKERSGDLRSCTFVGSQWGLFLSEYWEKSLRKY